MKRVLQLLLLTAPLLAQDLSFQHSFTRSEVDNPNDSYTSNKDHHILRNIREHVSSQFGTKYAGISIRVSNGLVTFEGSVENSQDRQAMTNKALSVQGVLNINNNLLITNRGQATDTVNDLNTYTTERDRQLTLNIRGALKNNFGNIYDPVRISIQNGVVRLVGVVKSQKDIDQIIATINSLDGVSGIDNQLTIKATPPANFGDNQTVDTRDSYYGVRDRQIVISLRSQLMNISSDRYAKIALDSTNGIVTLSGSVLSKEDAALAVNKALLTQGVASVNDLLTYPKA